LIFSSYDFMGLNERFSVLINWQLFLQRFKAHQNNHLSPDNQFFFKYKVSFNKRTFFAEGDYKWLNIISS